MLFCQLRTALIENPSASPRVGFDQRKDSSEQLRTAPRLRLHGKCLISFTTLPAKRYIITLSDLKKSFGVLFALPCASIEVLNIQGAMMGCVGREKAARQCSWT